MGDIAEIVKTLHEVLAGNANVPVTEEAKRLGMAYAIPAGTEDTIVDSYAPWHDAVIRQVFYRETALGAVSAEIQMIMSWQYSEAQQYIVNAYLDKNVKAIDPTVSASMSVRFDQPRPYDTDLEAYEIPFTVTVEYDPIGSNESVLFKGTIRADGAGTFAAA